MNVYSILKTPTGWGLYKSGSKRAKLEAKAREDVVKMSAEILIKETASVRIFSADGSFQELRFKGGKACS